MLGAHGSESAAAAAGTPATAKLVVRRSPRNCRSAKADTARLGPRNGDPLMTYELYYWPGIQGRGEFYARAGGSRRPLLDVAVLPKAKGGGVPAF